MSHWVIFHLGEVIYASVNGCVPSHRFTYNEFYMFILIGGLICPVC
jgi:hypothetical protein